MKFAPVLLLAIGCRLLAAAPAPTNPTAPDSFLRLRDRTLGYPGPAEDRTNLTEIRIGWFGPTNLNDPLTGDLWWAASLAVHEANAQPSEGSAGTADFGRLPFRLVPRWSVDPWGSGVSQLARMVYDEQPLALLGSVDSATTHLAEQVVAKANLPLVSPIATDPSVTLAGVSWMFSCAPSDQAVARVLVDACLAAVTAEGSTDGEPGQVGCEPAPGSVARSTAPAGCRLALLSGTDHESRMTTREVMREFSRRGRLPDFRFEVRSAAPALARQMQELAVARPAIVVVIATAEDAAHWVTAIREALPRARLYGGPSLGRARFRQLAGPAAEGVRFALLSSVDPADVRYSRFVQRFQAERGGTPDAHTVLTYDATGLLLEAIRQAGPNRARIRETLTRLSPWPGLAGSIQFDGTGQNTRTNLGLGTVKRGATVAWNPP